MCMALGHSCLKLNTQRQIINSKFVHLESAYYKSIQVLSFFTLLVFNLYTIFIFAEREYIYCKLFRLASQIALLFHFVTIGPKTNPQIWECHYSDVIMSAIATQITSVSIHYSTVGSGVDQWKHQTPRHWPLWGEFKYFHLRTSLWSRVNGHKTKVLCFEWTFCVASNSWTGNIVVSVVTTSGASKGASTFSETFYLY